MANTENKAIAKKPKKERKRNIGRFFREVFGEVKKLSWPSRKELISYSVTVLCFIALLAVIIYVLDLGFGEGLGLLARVDLSGGAEGAGEALKSAAGIM